MEFTVDIIFKDSKIRKLADYLHEKHKIFDSYVKLCVACCSLGFGLGYTTPDAKDDDTAPVNLPRNYLNRESIKETIMFIARCHFLQERQIDIKERTKLSVR